LTSVQAKVRQYIEAHGLLVRGEKVVVGVSGGPDSVCLLHVLCALHDDLELGIHVAHLNHGARSKEADADARFVETLAATWHLPLTVEREDVPGLARQHHLTFEEAARRVRYAFLLRVAHSTGARRIAVGHTADDQAETVLMHFLRGSALAGLRGMLPFTPVRELRLLEPFGVPASRPHSWDQRERQDPSAQLAIIRPLLQVFRSEVEAYCSHHDLAWRFDQSNLDITYFRNRLRHELLPVLKTYNPRIKERLCHTAAVIAADYDLLVEVRQDTWHSVVREHRADAIVFDRKVWRALPVALQRATVRHAAYMLRRSLRDVSFVHVEDARYVALHGETGAQATLPMNLALVVGYETLRIGNADATPPPPDEPLLWREDPLPVELPGATPLPACDWILRSQYLASWDSARIAQNTDPWTAYLDADQLEPPLLLRTRRRGDRFLPLGMEGQAVQLSAFMINRKIPQASRDHVPLLVTAGDIAWVCGHRIAETVAVGPHTSHVAHLWFARA
jgi:tRNA(Ile)-lysidine synthase